MEETRWIRDETSGKAEIENVDGVSHFDAPAPPRIHEHFAQTRGWLDPLHRVERCPCGAIRSNLRPRWVLLDPPRVAPIIPRGLFARMFGKKSS